MELLKHVCIGLEGFLDTALSLMSVQMLSFAVTHRNVYSEEDSVQA